MLGSNIARFPMNLWNRQKNRRGDRAVSCIVSSRFLRFASVGSSEIALGRPVFLDVFTETDLDLPPRKICQLVVTLEELQEIVLKLQKEVESEEE